MKKQPLWFWGAMCIMGAGFAGVIPELAGMRARTRPEMLGRGLAQLLFVVLGIVLIVMHFVRRGKTTRQDEDDEEVDERPRKPKKRAREQS